MPELAEVEITKRRLLPLVKNKVFSNFWTDWPRGLKLARFNFVLRDIRGRKILDGYRIGKVIFLRLSGKPERVLAFHQRMSGRFEYVPKNHPQILKNLRMKKTNHAHFVFRFSDKSELWFIDPRKFGIVWYGSPEDLQKDNYLKNLGVDLKKLTLEEFHEKLGARNQAIKAFLLRQDVISGIGNIIADESLWNARIHPKRKISSLSGKEMKNLFGSLQKTVDEILKAGGTSMRDWMPPTGKRGGYQKLCKVYGRVGKKCSCCERIIKRTIVAGRGTSFCSHCQK
ncbi:MAG: bifunctional DNA-formamidopyrimidine glycosylase/DNA-(apurinic or apyrimidinic site) lyase [bacterium]|nr:bifunctional DNA-formamidopyrimidine glycosylase/DNA-(apurinic or apyrimidinic site) lyase [bacterium]